MPSRLLTVLTFFGFAFAGDRLLEGGGGDEFGTVVALILSPGLSPIAVMAHLMIGQERAEHLNIDPIGHCRSWRRIEFRAEC